ncbi:MAG: cystathionine gamma-synthase [Omnitrophica bacterium RIFCSPLOWO2_12_FULL_44_17]|uniref:Cystathionine gamma-synthase n=1 Tax=Candidatus Danuiimicrobium aquiferis TaxID=1801832 RepID=A0A1G1KQF3_9BACT|nr:MAG: cystathionine gamma-synthase [Omnitrophica bacterium RIFCSPHIGHO2_02_FULL_45_28]OGW89539.1 MAG: cystathionine gamma-synthase [Omnitrophica bacterium RIFCSPHIGHO2_12_FULL_44_12]OGW95147.1 MAG: cystathionine gamma-synthase [Omnitrophica bacterium RIFCSPLOWO2_12_FULL_44_17]OGX01708.1 MAG: cystathionine gamma-synthase [Omnitrophica bacterium RIFCSPLOWO2_02_FULL_44_11]
MDIQTKAVLAGTVKDSIYNSVITPIYPTSTFRFDRLGQHKGYDYTRSGNPTRAALEENIAALEGGLGAAATATGMAAITAVMFLCEPGDHVITGNDIYGGSYRLFKDIFSKKGLSFSFINMMNLKEIGKAIQKNTKMIWIETPSNPLLHIVDLQSTIALAKSKGILAVIDNTFLSPYFQRPFEFGADIIVHSTTKYLNGHSDVVGGTIVYNDKKIEEKIKFLVNALGVSEAPFDSWLVLRGIKTLACRMETHQQNALKIATFLESHPRVKKVYYTGLKSHPQQALIKKQMKGFGGMLAFELDTSKISLDTFFSKVKLFQLAESLGGVESLIEHPWTMSHASMGPEGLKASGITQETIRVSVGIESANDLIGELKNALGK